MKVCFKCGAEKPLSEYYKHAQMADGHLNKCKTCTKKDSTKHRDANLEKIRAYDRVRGNRQSKEYFCSYRESHPNKYKAHTMVNNAIRDGKMYPEDCSSCGGNESPHAHHDDYAKPLNVRWLCPVCHSQWHRDNGPGING